jgi:hypothetical protein
LIVNPYDIEATAAAIARAYAMPLEERKERWNAMMTVLRANSIHDWLAGEGGLTLPRDNPVKDFLIDAEAKFAPFKAATRATSLLVIVWDDHIYEPITVLTQEQCGLLTPNSCYTDASGGPVTFPDIDAVVLIRPYVFQERGGRRAAGRAHACI